MPKLAQIALRCFRYPLDKPLDTVLGRIESRPALIVTIEDVDGAVGFGEIWCNYPIPGAEYRLRLAATFAKAVLADRDSDSPYNAFNSIRERLNPLALQAGEPGPVDQIAAGFDIALHDLTARRREVPLAELLGGQTRPLPAYASGIGPPNYEDLLENSLATGFEAFKLRIGFGLDFDKRMIAGARQALGRDRSLLVDVNQQWSLDAAMATVPILEEFELDWLEEPLPADRPEAEWRVLADSTSIPIAAGENLRNRASYDQVIKAGYLSVVQPDICKWGGLSACFDLANSIEAAGQRYCPHYLGGGIGLAASAQLLAATGGDGLLEVDQNENPLRDLLAEPLFPLRNGHVQVPQGAGLGYRPDLNLVAEFQVEALEVGLLE